MFKKSFLGIKVSKSSLLLGALFSFMLTGLLLQAALNNFMTGSLLTYILFYLPVIFLIGLKLIIPNLSDSLFYFSFAIVSFLFYWPFFIILTTFFRKIFFYFKRKK